MVVASWEGKTTQDIALELDCHPQTVRERVSRFNERGIEGLQDAPGRGRKVRLSEQERSTIVSLIGQARRGSWCVRAMENYTWRMSRVRRTGHWMP